MYVYDDFDQTLLNERVAEFSDQIKRRVSGELSEEEFRPLRLMNGTYLQLHAYLPPISTPHAPPPPTKLPIPPHVPPPSHPSHRHYPPRQTPQSPCPQL